MLKFWGEFTQLEIHSLTMLQSFKKIVHARPEQVGICPGFGEQKVKRLLDAFNEPFLAYKK
jgi:DNA excision repair protein ERCC-1